MLIQITQFALSYIDSDGKEVLCSAKGEEIELERQPLYVSYSNAEKQQKAIPKFIKKYHLSVLEYWYNIEIAKSFELQRKDYIKKYLDALLIIQNGLNIKEVSISVDLSK
jgi:hypothetical protein